MAEGVREKILEHFQLHGPCTRRQAREAMGYRVGQWDVHFRDLVAEGRLCSAGEQAATRGSPVTVYVACGEPAIDRFLSVPPPESVRCG